MVQLAIRTIACTREKTGNAHSKQRTEGDVDRRSWLKGEIGFWKWTPCTNTSPHSPQMIRATYLQSSTMVWSVQWCDRVLTASEKPVQSFKLIYCTCFFDVSPLDYNHFDGFLNCRIDFKDILNYLIAWDIDYTEACTTPITKIKTPRVNIHRILIYRCNDYFKHLVESSTC